MSHLPKITKFVVLSLVLCHKVITLTGYYFYIHLNLHVEYRSKQILRKYTNTVQKAKDVGEREDPFRQNFVIPALAAIVLSGKMFLFLSHSANSGLFF